MKLGFIPTEGGHLAREALAEVDRAEALGLDSVWMEEHHGVRGHYWPSPLVVLAGFAGRTSRLLLGTDVVVLPFYDPVRAAEDAAMVDVLSGGRLVFGIGVGYVEREFEALGASFGDRGARLEEYLAAIRAIWAEPRPSFAGATVSFAGVQAFPHPVRRPPVVMGGYAPPVMRRTIREADGWFGWGLDPDATARRIDMLRETAERVPRGEGLGPLEISISPPADVDVDTAARYAALGVDRLNLQLPWDAGPEGLDRFFERVIAPLVRADLRVGAR